MEFIIIFVLVIILVAIITKAINEEIQKKQYKKAKVSILNHLGLPYLEYLTPDDYVYCKSAKAVDNYTFVQYFKENRQRLEYVSNTLAKKRQYKTLLESFLKENEFSAWPMYSKVEAEIKENLKHLDTFDVVISYSSPTGRSYNNKTIKYTQFHVNALIEDPAPIMSKSEYNQMIKSKNKEQLDKKHHEYYALVNEIVDTANSYKDKLVIKEDQAELDKNIASLFDRTVNSIKKIKDIDSDEWTVIGNFISNIKQKVDAITERNQRILDYYDSSEFAGIKTTCNSLMESQKEFNEYINEKAQSISKLFGSRVTRNETVIDDEYDYIRPYKKSITPFTAEVSAQVFASAENSPIEYIIKYFYPNKDQYPEQIQKLQLLVEELETLKDAKQIIDNYKKDYQQYITNVPSYIMENDEDGFYSRLGFANISESALTVEYKFNYTSNGGMAQRNFTVPMTEETIIELINILQSKLSMASFAKEQRALMTSKLRQYIKERDDFTCKFCGNSTYKEPNLLLEIDHIIPVAKGGVTEENNLQTLCWKCNRSKSAKILP
ncbi:HNH endonuclease [Oribacterium sp. NK2B42]|uniref:HNH endonuclease n=1 Tax=Oribacterium sp. NK2B42 TaxID=689781 RepID=UPI000400D4A7|nr:HNH endonuclease signature motif containing protein [Oribacterium sp. NK2B42]